MAQECPESDLGAVLEAALEKREQIESAISLLSSENPPLQIQELINVPVADSMTGHENLTQIPELASEDLQAYETQLKNTFDRIYGLATGGSFASSWHFGSRGRTEPRWVRETRMGSSCHREPRGSLVR